MLHCALERAQELLRPQAEGTHWASVSADAAEAEQQAVADGLNIAAHGWAFEIPEFTAQTLLTTRDSLLAPAGG